MPSPPDTATRLRTVTLFPLSWKPAPARRTSEAGASSFRAALDPSRRKPEFTTTFPRMSLSPPSSTVLFAEPVLPKLMPPVPPIRALIAAVVAVLLATLMMPSVAPKLTEPAPLIAPAPVKRIAPLPMRRSAPEAMFTVPPVLRSALIVALVATVSPLVLTLRWVPTPAIELSYSPAVNSRSPLVGSWVRKPEPAPVAESSPTRKGTMLLVGVPSAPAPPVCGTVVVKTSRVEPVPVPPRFAPRTRPTP
jgi:hypothetical protein